MRNLLLATTDISCDLGVELDYDNLYDEFSNKEIIVKILDCLIADYIKISEKISTKEPEETEIKNELGLTGFQTLKN